MHDKLMKMMAKKKGEPMSDIERDAKMSVVDHLRREAGDEMAKRLDGLKKVSVMSDSNEGMQKGLEKAKELINQIPEHPEHEEHVAGDHAFEGEETPEEEAAEHEAMESPEHEEAEHVMPGDELDDEDEDMDEDEIDAKLQKLMALKKKKEMK